MADSLSETEYRDLQSQLTAGQASIIITRSMARQFFLLVGNHNVRDLTGRSVIAEKFCVLSLLLIALLLILAALVLIGRDFGYAAVFAIPLTGIFWTVTAGLATEHGGPTSTLLICLVCLAACAQLPRDYLWPATLFVVSVTTYRFVHFLAQYFLVRLIARSYDAYDMLSGQIEVGQVEQPS